MTAAKKAKPKPRAPRKKRVAIQRSEDGELTRETLDAVIASIRKRRLPRKYAATSNGISPRTLELWISMGACGLGGPLYAELARDVYQVEGRAVGRQMRNLDVLGREDPKAAVAFLQFFKPLDFGGSPPVGDEFQEPARNAQRQDLLLDNPPPRMLAKFRAHGWWKFSAQIDEEDRIVLMAIQEKYAALPVLPAEGAGG